MTKRRSKWQVAFTTLLVAFSAYVAVVTFPFLAGRIAAAMGTIACLALILRVGWIIPCTVGGVYVGLFMDASVKGGTAESQMWEFVSAIIIGAAVGCVIGLLLDNPVTHREQ